MIVSGPTSCGKTFLVYKLLKNGRIDPPPQRIIWLYKRWQPLYDIIGATVRVKFVQGIPLDLENDRYLDPKIRNLIVLDDLMSTANKDSRITDLFTEGSHHRNLSVIAINQNLYQSKDPTQRRNCHYLALFNNPIDKQQVLTLARQMYPENTRHFMNYFERATHRPFGHLMVDLKPTTPEMLRLRPNGLETRPCVPERYKGVDVTANIPDDLSPASRKQQLCKFSSYYGRSKSMHSSSFKRKLPGIPDYESDDNEEDEDVEPFLKKVKKMQSCDTCGIVFKDGRNVQRHLRLKICENDEEKGEISNDHENEGIRQMIDREYDINRDYFQEKKQRFRDRNMSQDDIEKRLKALKWKLFKETYSRVLTYMYYFDKGTNSRNILQSVDSKTDVRQQIRTRLNKYRSWIGDYLDEANSHDDDDDDDDDNDISGEE
jgi:hypothetical protein